MENYPFDVHKVWVIRDGILSRNGEDSISEAASHATVEDLIEAGLVIEAGMRVECVPMD